MRTPVRLGQLLLLTLSLASMLLRPDVTNAQAPVPPGCQSLVLNGGFEEDSEWRLTVTAWPAQIITTDQAYEGERSLVVGLPADSENEESHSIAQQSFVVPAGTSQVTLTASLWPVAPATGDDRNYLIFQSLEGDIVSIAVYNPLAGDGWEDLTVDVSELAEYQGQEVIMQIGVFNDGLEERTRMLVDGLSLIACVEATSVDTPTPEATATGTLTPEATATDTLTPEATATTTPISDTTDTPTATAVAATAPTASATPIPSPTGIASRTATATAAPSPEATNSPAPTPVTTLPLPPDRTSALASLDGAPVVIGVALSAVLALAVLIYTSRSSGR